MSLSNIHAQVLAALDAYFREQDRLDLDHESEPLPDRLTRLGISAPDVYVAVADLQQMGLIIGVEVAERDYPVVLLGLTAEGRQNL